MPFQLMYDQEVVVIVEYMVLSLRIVFENQLGDTKSLKEQLFQLNKLHKRRALVAIEAMQK